MEVASGARTGCREIDLGDYNLPGDRVTRSEWGNWKHDFVSGPIGDGEKGVRNERQRGTWPV
jgi:hypothetical protein